MRIMGFHIDTTTTKHVEFINTYLYIFFVVTNIYLKLLKKFKIIQVKQSIYILMHK